MQHEGNQMFLTVNDKQLTAVNTVCIYLSLVTSGHAQ